jgi:hypothetical protein
VGVLNVGVLLPAVAKATKRGGVGDAEPIGRNGGAGSALSPPLGSGEDRGDRLNLCEKRVPALLRDDPAPKALIQSGGSAGRTHNQFNSSLLPIHGL